MMLRDIELENQKEGTSAIAGLSAYWQDADNKSKVEWTKWEDLFAVAVVANYSLSVEELTFYATKDKCLHFHSPRSKIEEIEKRI